MTRKLIKLVDKLGLKTEISTASNSMFGKINNNFAIFSKGNNIGYVKKNGFLIHTLDRELENTLTQKDLKDFLSIY